MKSFIALLIVAALAVAQADEASRECVKQKLQDLAQIRKEGQEKTHVCLVTAKKQALEVHDDVVEKLKEHEEVTQEVREGLQECRKQEPTEAYECLRELFAHVAEEHPEVKEVLDAAGQEFKKVALEARECVVKVSEETSSRLAEKEKELKDCFNH